MPSTTASTTLDKQLQSLVAGFDALQDEYQRLYSRCQILESQLDTAKTKYADLTSQCPHKAEPLLLADTKVDTDRPESGNALALSAIANGAQRDRIMAACRLSQQLRPLHRTTPNGVKIHTGPSADKVSAPNSSAMPSISESPLEQDFTVPGTPSRLDCPFASMTNRRLSSHAASIVSRYRPGTSTPKSSVSRVNGRASSVTKGSVTDPIKAETCGMASLHSPQDVESSVQGSAGVCPIRFLDQHSPEEVAAYFESHKHELPRSHEMCVKRYQSNEESIKELDAKYGNLVSMIQGLGQKHVSMLPDTPGDAEDDLEDDHLSAEKIRKWASSIGTNAAEITPEDDDPDDEERQQRFDRPLKDVRLGESPSRPWGIQVPIHINRHESYASTIPVPASGPVDQQQPNPSVHAEKPRGQCPFGFDAMNTKPAAKLHESVPAQVAEAKENTPRCDIPQQSINMESQAPQNGQKHRPSNPVGASESAPQAQPITRPAFINAPPSGGSGRDMKLGSQTVFTGPVFIGYSLEDAMKVLQASSASGADGC